MNFSFGRGYTVDLCICIFSEASLRLDEREEDQRHLTLDPKLMLCRWCMVLASMRRLTHNILDSLYDSFLYVSDNSLDLSQILTLAWKFRILLWLFMATVCAVLPSHNPGDDVVQFPLTNAAASNDTCFSMNNTFCDCGFDCNWKIHDDDHHHRDNGGDSDSCFEFTNGESNFLQSHVYPFLLRPLTRWDAARFLRLALYPQLWQPHPVDNNQQESEQAHAFFPLFPTAVQYMAKLLRLLLPQACLPKTCASLLVLSAWLVNSLCFAVAVIALYQTTLSLLQQGHGSSSSSSSVDSLCHASRVTLLFVFNPASVFFATAYSEALFSALVFTASYCMVLSSSSSSSSLSLLPAAAAVMFWCLATATRSNGMLYTGYMLLYGAGILFQSDRPLLGRMGRFLTSCGAAILISYPIYRHNQRAIVSHCQEGGSEDKFEWCALATENPYFFYLYSYIQRKHWNVGLFRYYQWKQIPNFLLAAPILILSAVGVADWCRRSWIRVASADQKPGQVVIWAVESLRDFANAGRVPQSTGAAPLSAVNDVLVGNAVLGHYAVWAVAALLGLTTAHVQISTRLLCSSCPALYWYAAHLMTTSKPWGSVYLGYCLLYIILGSILHPLWLPWT